MKQLRNVLGQPKRRFTAWEKVYIGFMTIVLSYRIASSIFLQIGSSMLATGILNRRKNYLQTGHHRQFSGIFRLRFPEERNTSKSPLT